MDCVITADKKEEEAVTASLEFPAKTGTEQLGHKYHNGLCIETKIISAKI
ncbi:MAG: hypothetical protein WC476_05840 [Phycisphaerae bacterium]|jgi:hypothetical protein